MFKVDSTMCVLDHFYHFSVEANIFAAVLSSQRSGERVESVFFDFWIHVLISQHSKLMRNSKSLKVLKAKRTLPACFVELSSCRHQGCSSPHEELQNIGSIQLSGTFNTFQQ